MSLTRHSSRAPDNFLWQAILVTLCCCWPFGIPSIVYFTQVNAKFLSGDMDGAHASAKKAQFWFCWVLGVGLVVNFFAFIIILAAD